MKFDKIFLGDSPHSMRRYLIEVLRFLKEEGHEKLWVPACGQFAIVKIALQSGYKPENIWVSDISLFSSLCGNFYAGKPIDEIDFMLSDEREKEYKKYKKEESKLAYLMWLMKISQLHPTNDYEQAYYNEFQVNKQRYIDELKATLMAYRDYYAGINYDLLDLREVVTELNQNGGLMMINPPIYGGDYAKMFNFDPNIFFDPEIPQFHPDEYMELYESSREGKSLSFWYKHKSAEGVDLNEVVYGKDFGADRVDYIITTQPEILPKRLRGVLDSKEITQTHGKYEILDADFELTSEVKISFKSTDADTAMYYRDLFAHRLGLNLTEEYYLIFFDGKLFGVAGFNLSELRRMISDVIFETFGFNTRMSKYSTASRLMSMILMSREFLDFVKAQAKTNRFFDIRKFKTTCMSKYRKSKVCNGLQDIVKKEKMKDGQYKLLYIGDVFESTANEMLEKYLEEL